MQPLRGLEFQTLALGLIPDAQACYLCRVGPLAHIDVEVDAEGWVWLLPLALLSFPLLSAPASLLRVLRWSVAFNGLAFPSVTIVPLQRGLWSRIQM
eukprot:3472025-Amphidinium_carterae.1